MKLRLSLLALLLAGACATPPEATPTSTAPRRIELPALVDFLVDRFGPEPEWDPCWFGEINRERAALAGARA